MIALGCPTNVRTFHRYGMPLQHARSPAGPAPGGGGRGGGGRQHEADCTCCPHPSRGGNPTRGAGSASWPAAGPAPQLAAGQAVWRPALSPGGGGEGRQTARIAAQARPGRADTCDFAEERVRGMQGTYNVICSKQVALSERCRCSSARALQQPRFENRHILQTMATT